MLKYFHSKTVHHLLQTLVVFGLTIFCKLHYFKASSEVLSLQMRYKEAVLCYFMIQFQNFPVGTEENHENLW
jgi:hypothetical protein